MTSKKLAVGAIALLIVGAIGGALVLNSMNERSARYDRNVDIAYASAKRLLESGSPSVDPFAEKHENYAAFADECERGVLMAIHYAGGPDKEKPLEMFELAGFAPAFDEYRIAIYKVISASGRRAFVGCLVDENFEWKAMRTILSAPAGARQ